MFEPAVFAITIPDSPRREETMETSFSGRVVAKERSVTPRREEERLKEAEMVLMEWLRIYPDSDRARKPNVRFARW